MSRDPAPRKDPAPRQDLAGWADRLEARIASDRLTIVDRVFVLTETASTQDAARRLAAGKPGVLVIAGRQTAGRGRLGRSWNQAGEHGLAATFVLDARAHDPGHLAIAAGVACAKACEAVLAHQSGALQSGAGGFSPPEASQTLSRLGIRWPNDIVDARTGRKLAGILIESADGLAAVGFGINVSHRPPDWPGELNGHAVSLAQLGASAGRQEVSERLLSAFHAALTATPASLQADWRTRDVLTGAPARFHSDGILVEGTVESIAPTHEIIVRRADGSSVRLEAASTSLLHA